MVDASGESDFRRLEWVVGGEVDIEEEDAAGVRAVTLSGVSTFREVDLAASSWALG